MDYPNSYKQIGSNSFQKYYIFTNSKINKIYQVAIKKGEALGGKLIGAGGGGFLMFYTNNKVKLIKILSKYGLKNISNTHYKIYKK